MGFQKGVSGNPGGKSRTHKKFQELLALELQAKTGGPAAKYFCKKLIDFIEFGDTHKVKFAALELAMAYFMGRPHNTIDLETDGDQQIIIVTGVPQRGAVAPEPLIVVDPEDQKPDGTNDN